MAVKIPVLVLNWNGYQDTVDCIDSLLNQNEIHPVIFLGDNLSDNDEGARLKRLYENEERVGVYLFDKNHGFAEGCNRLLAICLQQMNPEYVALLNNDAIADPSWLAELYKFAKAKNCDVVSSKMLRFDNPQVLDTVGHKMITTGEIVPIGHDENASDYNQSFEHLGACAGACLYSASMLKELGMFDNYFHTGYEDAELGVRAVIAGYHAAYCPKAMVRHKVSQSVSKIFNMDYLITIQKSIYYTVFKLVPKPVLIYTILGLSLKLPAMFLLNTITRKPKHNIMHREALKAVWKDRELIRQKRETFYAGVKPISTLSLRSKQHSFLVFDTIRVLKFRVFKSANSEFDKVD